MYPVSVREKGYRTKRKENKDRRSQEILHYFSFKKCLKKKNIFRILLSTVDILDLFSGDFIFKKFSFSNGLYLVVKFRLLELTKIFQRVNGFKVCFKGKIYF